MRSLVSCIAPPPQWWDPWYLVYLHLPSDETPGTLGSPASPVMRSLVPCIATPPQWWDPWQNGITAFEVKRLQDLDAKRSIRPPPCPDMKPLVSYMPTPTIGPRPLVSHIPTPPLTWDPWSLTWPPPKSGSLACTVVLTRSLRSEVLLVVATLCWCGLTLSVRRRWGWGGCCNPPFGFSLIPFLLFC